MTKWVKLVFIAAASFALVMALLPQPPPVPGQLTDKFQHVTAFAVLTLLACAGWPAVRTRTIVVGLTAFGAMIELAQMIPALHRDASSLDWVADAMAVVITVGIALAIRRVLTD